MDNLNNTYTLQSMRTGKYISSLFSDTHDETFQAKTIEDAYTWNSIKAAQEMKYIVGHCLLVKL